MAMDNLMKRFPTFFKESQRCRPPNVNIDILRDKIFQSDLLTSKNISSSGELIELINIANMNYSKLSDLDLEKRIITAGNFQSKGPMLKQAIAKAKEHSFFLGIDDNWLK